MRIRTRIVFISILVVISSIHCLAQDKVSELSKTTNIKVINDDGRSISITDKDEIQTIINGIHKPIRQAGNLGAASPWRINFKLPSGKIIKTFTLGYAYLVLNNNQHLLYPISIKTAQLIERKLR